MDVSRSRKEREREKNQSTFNDRVRAIKEQQVSLLSKQQQSKHGNQESRVTYVPTLYTPAVYLSLLSKACPRTRIKGENKVERHSPLVKVVLRSMSQACCVHAPAHHDRQASSFCVHQLSRDSIFRLFGFFSRLFVTFPAREWRLIRFDLILGKIFFKISNDSTIWMISFSHPQSFFPLKKYCGGER